ncbi:zinc ribbon domain-containing protein, partial [Companilactobacillus mindensis]
HDLIVAEELRSSNMLKNHALAMSISDVGWRTFLNMLAYKADLYGRKFLTIDPKNTTQTCSNCGHILSGA